MTVDSTNNRTDYDPDGVVTTFAYDFRVDSSDDMVVYADGVVYTGPYTVTELSNPVGGDVVFDDPPAASIEVLTLIREVEITQQTAYPPLGPFPAPTHEKALDKLTFISQQQQEQINRSGVAPVDADPVTDYTLPKYSPGQYWAWDRTEQKLISIDLSVVVSSDGVPIVENIASLRVLTPSANLKYVDVAGYNAIGDGGGGPRRIGIYGAASGTYTDNGGSVIVPNGGDGSAAWVWGIPESVDIREWGVFGIGDESVQISQALSSGGLLSIPSGNYTVSQDITVTQDISIVCEPGAILTFTTGALIFTGSLSSALKLSSDIGKHALSLPLVSASSIEEDDLIIVHDPTDYSFSDHRADYTKGEFYRVVRKTNDILYIGKSTYFAYESVPTNVYKVNPITVSITGLTIKGSTGSSDNYPLSIIFGEEIVLDRVYVTGGYFGAILLDKCYNFCVKQTSAIHENDSGQGRDYGLSLANCSKGIAQGYFYGYRHGVSFGGDSADGSVPCKNIVIEKSQVYNDPLSSQPGAEFHGNSILCKYDTCEILSGVVLGGEDCGYEDCKVIADSYNYLAAVIEIVGGTCYFRKGVFDMSKTGFSGQPIGTPTGAVTENIAKDYLIDFTNNTCIYNSAQQFGFVVAYAHSNLIEGNWDLSGNSMLGDLSGITRIIYHIQAGSVNVAQSVKMDTLKYDDSLPLGTPIFLSNGSASGLILTTPKESIIKEITIPAGNWRGLVSINSKFSYDGIPGGPAASAEVQNNAVYQYGYLFGSINAVTHGYTLALHTSAASETLTSETTAKVAATLGCDLQRIP